MVSDAEQPEIGNQQPVARSSQLAPRRIPRTKIVATIGPACWDEGTLRALLLAGVSVARFNFSHADYESTEVAIRLVRRIADEEKLNVAVLADLQGPRIRVGVLASAGITLSPGEQVTLSTREGGARHTGTTIPVDYEGLAEDVLPGDTIL